MDGEAEPHGSTNIETLFKKIMRKEHVNYACKNLYFLIRSKKKECLNYIEIVYLLMEYGT